MSGPLGRGQWQLLLFGGKGGVGKTTCAAAAAVALAQESPDQRFVLVSTDPAHSTRHVLADARLPNLTVREIDAAESLRRFKQKHTEQLEKIALRGTILDPEEVQALLDLSLPGLDEIMAFLEISRLVENGEYRCVLVDTAPMGHTLRFLGLFELMERWFQALDAMLAKHRYLSEVYRGEYQPDEVDKFLEQLHQSLTVLANLLRDEQRCRFVAVLLPEELSLLQTRRLLDGLSALHISITDLIVNQVFSPGQSAKENGHACQENPSCPICGDTRARQAAVTWQIAARFCEQVLWQAPLWPGEVRGAETLARFWKSLTPLVVAPTRTFTGPAPTILVECPAPLPAPEVRLLLLAGKGGVGKSTLACATALRLAETYPDQRVLLFSTDPAHSLSGCLNRSIGPGETEICPGLWAVEIDAAAELVELKTRYAREVARFFEKLGGQDSLSLEFDAPVFERVMDLAPPGLDEMMALVRVVKLLQTRGSDRFVLDTAPSGHLVRLLETPALIEDWLKVVFGLLLKYRNVLRLPQTSDWLVELSRGLKALRALLTDPVRSQVYVVSLLTDLSLEKTHELVTACTRLHLVAPVLFLNQATPPSACTLCAEQRRREEQLRQRFAQQFAGMHQVVIDRHSPLYGPERLRQVGRALYHAPSRVMRR